MVAQARILLVRLNELPCEQPHPNNDEAQTDEVDNTRTLPRQRNPIESRHAHAPLTPCG